MQTENTRPTKTFIPLECNPEVFTELIQNLGVPGLKFQDVLSVTEPDLIAMVERPVYSLVFIYPGDSKAELQRKYLAQGGDVKYNACGDEEQAMWYRQTIRDACGLHAILHALSNGPAREIIPSSSPFAAFLEDCAPLRVEDRAVALESSLLLESAHSAAALKGDTQAPNLGDASPPHHFVAFVRGKDNHLYEMNGALNGPLDLGVELKEGNDLFVDEVLAVVKRFIDLAEGKNPYFHLMALVPA